VYPFYRGGDLWSFLEKQREYRLQGFAVLRDAASQIAYGLWRLHLKGFVHRDLKPENVLRKIKEGQENTNLLGTLVITDYGLAVQGCSTKNRTCAKGCAGTPLYFAAPQFDCNGETSYGPEVDWHAFGVILYQLAAGLDTHPFYPEEELEQNVKRGDPDLDNIKIIDQDGLKNLIWRCLQAEPIPIDRPQSWFAENVAQHPILSHRFFTQGEDWQSLCKKHHPNIVDNIDPCATEPPITAAPLCSLGKRPPVVNSTLSERDNKIQGLINEHCPSIDKLYDFADVSGHWVSIRSRIDVDGTSILKHFQTQSWAAARQIHFKRSTIPDDVKHEELQEQHVCSVDVMMYKEKTANLIERKSDYFTMQCRFSETPWEGFPAQNRSGLACGDFSPANGNQQRKVNPTPYHYKSHPGNVLSYLKRWGNRFLGNEISDDEGEEMRRGLRVVLGVLPDKYHGFKNVLLVHETSAEQDAQKQYPEWAADFELKRFYSAPA